MPAEEISLKAELISLGVRVGVLTVLGYYTMRLLINAVDPTHKQKVAAEKKARDLMKKLGMDEGMKLTEHELTIASHLVEPESITTSWADIAGLEDLVRELQETVILPIQKRKLFGRSNLTQAPKGVLLHGPPGRFCLCQMRICRITLILNLNSVLLLDEFLQNKR